MPGLLDRLRKFTNSLQLPLHSLVRSSGIIFAALAPPEKNPDTLQQLTAAVQGCMRFADEFDARATVEHCPTELKREINVWGPPRADLEMMRSLKSEFDPGGILSPGRFYGGL
jgi:FAD/FMN-containing dehydrogenase